MAATDYTEFVTLAQEIIADNGRDVTIQLLSSTPANAATPWRGPATPTVQTQRTVKAVFVPSQGTNLGIDVVSDELLRRVEEVCLIAPTDIELQGFTRIVDGGVNYTIDWVQVLKPGPLIVLYFFGIKR